MNRCEFLSRYLVCWSQLDSPMTPSRRVAVITPTPDVAKVVIRCLMAAGHTTILLSDFLEARSELDEHPPDLLVTEVKLGAFNGLHLAIRARGRRAHTRTILLGDPDSVLQAEMSQQQIPYLTLPLDEDMFSATVRTLLQEPIQLLSPDALNRLPSGSRPKST